MKKGSFFATFTCLLFATGACSTKKTKDNRSPASIREVANHLNKKVIQKKRPRVKFLRVLNQPEKLKQQTGLSIQKTKTGKILSSDTNNDGKADVVSFFSNNKTVALKIDRNFDGNFDRTEVLKGTTTTIKYDNDFDGNIDKVLISKPVATNQIKQTVYFPKSKKRVSYILLTSSANSSDSEGRFCGDCEENFRRAVRDLRSDEAKEAQKKEWDDNFWERDIDNYVTIPGYKHTYLQVEPTIWFSDSCSNQGEDLAILVSDAINDYYDCMNQWRKSGSNTDRKSLIKRRNANKLLQGLVNTVSNTKKPLKIHCSQSKEIYGGWAITDKHSNNPSNIPLKDAIGSIVLDKDDLESDSEIIIKNTIMHEITHLFSGSHGKNCDNASSCPALCLGKNSLRGSKKLSASEWEDLKPSIERSCLAEKDYTDDLSTKLDPSPYSYLNDVYKLYHADGGSQYVHVELGNHIVREIKNNGKTGKIPIQNLPQKEREILVFNYLLATGDWKESEALRYINNFNPDRITDTEVPFGETDVLIPSLILDRSPITKERLEELINLAEKNNLKKSTLIYKTLNYMYHQL